MILFLEQGSDFTEVPRWQNYKRKQCYDTTNKYGTLKTVNSCALQNKTQIVSRFSQGFNKECLSVFKSE